MNTALPAEVAGFAGEVRRRFTALGGVELARGAETDRALRAEAETALRALGGLDLDVRGDVEELLAATQLCRAAGAVVLPWPVVDDLLRIDGRRLALVDPAQPRVDHGDLAGGWIGSDLGATAYDVVPGAAGRAKIGPFVVAVQLTGRGGDVDPDDVARHLVLGAWRILGALETAVSQVVEHVKVRRQFRQPLAEFQTVRFAVADASVALRGLTELAMFTSWRISSAPPAQRRADAVALRLSAAETATRVLRTCHQLLGAVGFCDEHDVSVLDRHVQPLLRQPLSPERLALRLLPAVRSGELETLFS